MEQGRGSGGAALPVEAGERNRPVPARVRPGTLVRALASTVRHPEFPGSSGPKRVTWVKKLGQTGVHQSNPHGPEHHLLPGPEPQLLLDPRHGVAHGEGAVVPDLADLVVGQPPPRRTASVSLSRSVRVARSSDPSPVEGPRTARASRRAALPSPSTTTRLSTE